MKQYTAASERKYDHRDQCGNRIECLPANRYSIVNNHAGGKAKADQHLECVHHHIRHNQCVLRQIHFRHNGLVALHHSDRTLDTSVEEIPDGKTHKYINIVI